MKEKTKAFIYKVLKSIVTLNGSPKAIALGTAIGVFIAFTPTIGFQMALGAFFATLMRASRPAAMIPAWLTNPVTIPPVYAFTFWLGKLFWHGPTVAEVYNRLMGTVKALGKFSWYAFHQQFAEFLKIGLDVFICMWIGGIILGAVLAAGSYPLVLWAVQGYRHQVEALRRRLHAHHAGQQSAAPAEAADGTDRRPGRDETS